MGLESESEKLKQIQDLIGSSKVTCLEFTNKNDEIAPAPYEQEDIDSREERALNKRP